MLVNLHVKNLAIIDEVEVDFSENMNVLTGETGAGKSIIIGSVNLALGGKFTGDTDRSGSGIGGIIVYRGPPRAARSTRSTWRNGRWRGCADLS